MFPSTVTEWADVVLPVAAAPEKAGTYLDWEGRPRSFDATLHGTGQLPDGRVLQGLADEMDVALGLPTPEAARAELAALGSSRRPAEGIGLDVRPPSAPDLPAGETAVLASWRQLIDTGTLQRDEPELAGTARPSVARIGADAAGRLGLTDGDRLTVSGATGSVTLPVRITAMPDRVVWLPMRSPGSEIRTDLGSGPGGVVRLSVGGVA
jgi:NADH-quinone oxidoreductase subunit G